MSAGREYDPEVTLPSPGVYELGDVERLEVSFPSDGEAAAAHLYLPPPRSRQGRRPAVVIDGPSPSVKEITAPVYAIKLARAGHIVLTFDRLGFGASAGRFRQHLDPAQVVRTIRDAVTYLAARDDVDPDRIAGMGLSMGGGFMMEAAAFDRRFRAVAAVAGYFSHLFALRARLGHHGWVRHARSLAVERQADLRAGTLRTHRALGPSSATAGSALILMDEAYEFYTQRQRHLAPHWRNELTYRSMEEILRLDAFATVHLIAPTPLLVVHGVVDQPEQARELLTRAGEPKKLVWVDCRNHVQLYDREPHVSRAAAELAAWFRQHGAG